MFENARMVLVPRTAADEEAAAVAFARSRAGRSDMAEELAMQWALANPLAARLASEAPGVRLAATLDDLAVTQAPHEDLLEAVGAWERMAAWVAARQARVIQELQRRAAGSTWAERSLREEVAGTLAVSGRAASILMDRARELTESPEVHDALAEGALSVRKADVLLRDTGVLTGAEARHVHEELLPDAHLMTAPQLSQAARRAVLELEPEAAEERHRRAREDRCVVLEPAGDCMAILRAYLPATDAVRAMRALDTIAAAAAPDDPRGIDARRADALTDVLGAVLDRGTTPDGRLLAPRKGRAPRLSLTISTDALAGAAGSPGMLDGYGPVVPSLARELAAEATWHFQRTDPATREALEQPGSRYRPPDSLRAAIVARDVTCTFPGCRVSADACDLDHTIPFDDTRDPAEQTRRGNLAALCRHHHRLKTHGRWTPCRDEATGVVTWTSPSGKPYTRDPVAAAGTAQARGSGETDEKDDPGGGKPEEPENETPDGDRHVDRPGAPRGSEGGGAPPASGDPPF